MDAHLLKPVQQEELLETIYRVMRKDEGRGLRDVPEPGSQESRYHPPSPVPCPCKSWWRRTTSSTRSFWSNCSARRGHQVRLASDGREALRQAERGGFDLLLLDIHMPELDGFQVVRAIRERERATGGHLPVIALTARSRTEDRDRCLAAGMDDFLAKPIQAADLWAAIDRAVGGRPPADRPDPGLLAPHVLLAACGNDAAILERICQTVRAHLPGHLSAIRDALRDDDAVRLREAAHKLAGMAGVFSSEVGGVASQLEDQAAQGQLQDARPLAARLEGLAAELLRLVDGLSIESLRRQADTAGPG